MPLSEEIPLELLDIEKRMLFGFVPPIWDQYYKTFFSVTNKATIVEENI